MEWWRDEQGHALTRDYFRVESREGVRVWLYREGLFNDRFFDHARRRTGSCTACSHEQRPSRFPFRRNRAPKPMRPRPPMPNSPSPPISPSCAAASHPEELVEQAKKLGLAGLGIADRNTVAGVVRAHTAAHKEDTDDADEKDIKLAVGARLVFADGTPDILAYPQDRAAWGRLTRLLTVGKSRGDKGECILYRDDLLEHIGGLNLIVLPPERIDADALLTLLSQLKAAASRDSVWLAASMLYRGDDQRRLTRLIAIADDAAVPLIAVNDVLYHAPERRPLQDVVTCIREHVTIETAGRRLEANAERHLKPPQEMARLFRKAPEAIAETLNFLDRCNFSLDELRKTEYPEETRQGFATPQDALARAGEGRRATPLSERDAGRMSGKRSTRSWPSSASSNTRRTS